MLGKRRTHVVFALVLLVAVFAHGVNMFRFPYYENDEGVYLSQAWSLLTQGKMAPYTYWYDHAPGGWMFLALWLLLSGGLYTFGFSLNSGRVFMLILQVASTGLLMVITRKFTRSLWAAAVAGLLFALTPIGLYFHRRILLDNIMTFWVLLSYCFLVYNRLKIHDVVASAFAFGIAVLTKENAIFFIPGFLYTLYRQSHTHHRALALLKWLCITGSIVSLYFLYALLKGEFFPSGTPLGGDHEHVSLLTTLKYQSSREGGSFFDVSGSSFWHNTFLWLRQDPAIMLGGVAAQILVLPLLLWRRRWDYVGPWLLGFFFWVFLVRGGIVIEFYVVPLLPILSLLLALLSHEVRLGLSRLIGSQGTHIVTGGALAALCIGYTIFAQVSRSFGQNSANHYIFRSQQTQAQTAAVDWMRTHVDPENIIIIDNHAYLDLQDPANPSGISFRDAEWYWKVDQDREVREDLLHNDPQRIDLIAVTPQMTGDLLMGTSPLTTEALNNAKIWKTFEVDGWGVQLWRPIYPRHILARSWESYKRHFMERGQVFDRQRDNLTTSEGQSYALLRAVWLDDRQAFDEVLAWTNRHLRLPTNLFAWKYLDGRIIDRGSATDADQDIALALLFASRRWGSDEYRQQAQNVLDAIWTYERATLNERHYLLPGPWAKKSTGLVLNPSYFSPYAYRIFAEADPEHDWLSLVDTSYEVLELCSAAPLNVERPVFLPPEWCFLYADGTVGASREPGLQATEYSYNAFRVPWRVALDARWFADPRARAYLAKLTALREEWQQKRALSVAYTHEGRVWEAYESAAAYGANLGAFVEHDASTAHELYELKIVAKFYEDDTQSYWEDPHNYYTQNWAWFGTALYGNLLPNLWSARL